LREKPVYSTGWGINKSFGGMRIYEAMREIKPQFFIQSGDSVYSDGPILLSVTAENGHPSFWGNSSVQFKKKAQLSLRLP